jgi:hypothetical protein
MFGLASTLAYHPSDCLSNFVKFLDIAVRDPATLQRLDRTALQDKVTSMIFTQLDELDA